ncbi:CPBP family intramembrane glutamic endopeptidase [Pseudobacteriovorax antillogorgiicola]|nr:CPBP family intramembrane glutamic endopeptidase [Pseudobacteriovorax antillogorgiicola]
MLLFASKEAIYVDGIEIQYTHKLSLEPPLKIIYTIFTSALMEEILFRVMLIGLLAKLNFRFKILISSIVFTLSHVSLYQLEIPLIHRAETASQLLLSGLLLGMLYKRYSLSTAVVFHILYNSYTAFLRPVLVNLERLQLGLLLCLGVIYSLIVVGREIKIIVNNRLIEKHWSLDT